MSKKLLIVLAMLGMMNSALLAQTVEGGAGVVFVDADPNTIAALEDVTANEANIAYNRSTRIMYVFDPAGTAGTDQWIAVDVTSAVTDVTGSGDIVVTQTGTTYDVDFSETHTTLSWDPATNQLTYTSEDGPATVLDISGAVDFDDSANIEVASGDGSPGSPFTFLIVGSDQAASTGKVPVTDGTTGALTWTNVVQGAEITADGQLQLTFTDGSTVNVNLDSAPKVANMTELNGEIATLTAASGVSGNTETGIAIAKDDNTFGLPADSDFGVIFFIKSN